MKIYLTILFLHIPCFMELQCGILNKNLNESSNNWPIIIYQSTNNDLSQFIKSRSDNIVIIQAKSHEEKKEPDKKDLEKLLEISNWIATNFPNEE